MNLSKNEDKLSYMNVWRYLSPEFTKHIFSKCIYRKMRINISINTFYYLIIYLYKPLHHLVKLSQIIVNIISFLFSKISYFIL